MAIPSTPQTAQPPPDLPNMPDVSTTLTNYLRNFALWCRNGFADSLRSKSALPGIMIQATDAATGKPTTFTYVVGVKVTVTSGVPSAPTITFTPITAGSGSP